MNFNLSDTANVPHLLPGEIHLWTASKVALKDHIGRLQSVLSPEEKKKAAYYKFEPVQKSYIISQAVLRLLLAGYLNGYPSDVKIGVHNKGKPFLMNDTSLNFNISNSYDICVFAFSRDGEVGIDLEKIRELPDIDQLIEKNLTSREKAYVLKDPDQKLSRFFQFWTFKESYLKAIGEGMRLTPENLDFALEDGTISLRSVRLGVDASDWLFKGFTRDGNYTGTLTYKKKETVIREMNLVLS